MVVVLAIVVVVAFKHKKIRQIKFHDPVPVMCHVMTCVLCFRTGLRF